MDLTALGLKLITFLVTFFVLFITYRLARNIFRKLGSNGRAIAYLLSVVAYPVIILLSLTTTGINLGALTAVTSALVFALTFGGQEVVKNSIAIFLNLRDDVYQLGDMISFIDGDSFYQIVGIRVSGIKLLDRGARSGSVVNVPANGFSERIINYTQDGQDTLCKYGFSVSLKAKISQPGKGDINTMESVLHRAANETQQWIIDNTQNVYAKESFAAQSTKTFCRKDVPAAIALTKVEKFINHYNIKLWIPGAEIFKVAAVRNHLLTLVWLYATELHNIEMATPDTTDDTDLVEANFAIAESIRLWATSQGG